MNPDVVAILQSASWPAFLVDEGGRVVYFNQAASIWFGPKIQESPPLDTLWCDQSETSVQFLKSWEHLTPPGLTIQFSGREANLQTFTTRISSLRQEEGRLYLFQLFKMEAPPNIVPKPAPKPAAPKPAPPQPSPDATTHAAQLKAARDMAREVTIDLNNALTSILGHASLVLSQIGASHPNRNSIAEVESAAERAAKVITRLVEFSRHEELPRKPTQPSKLNLLIRQAVDRVRQTNCSKIEFKLALDEAPYHVDIEDSKLVQTFIKVLENARETFDSYGCIEIHSRNVECTGPLKDERITLQPGVYACVEIIDAGPGMTPDVVDRMFEPFFTTKPGHKGLGLPWVYGMLTNLGGAVAVTTSPNQGCAVRIYLPATPQGPDHDPAKPHILMVDDETHVLETGRAILTAAGYRVSTADSAVKALATATESTISIDLVITDLVMPQIGGAELIDQLRTAAPGTPVLRISGYLPAGEKNDKSYLQKPFTSRHLLECVKQALDGTDAG